MKTPKEQRDYISSIIDEINEINKELHGENSAENHIFWNPFNSKTLGNNIYHLQFNGDEYNAISFDRELTSDDLRQMKIEMWGEEEDTSYYVNYTIPQLIEKLEERLKMDRLYKIEMIEERNRTY